MDPLSEPWNVIIDFVTQKLPVSVQLNFFESSLIPMTPPPPTDYKKMGNMTGTVRKHTPTLEALKVLYHRMRFEYEFYNFIRDQFHLTKKKIGLKSVSQPTAHSPAFLRELALRTPEPLEEDEDLDTDLEDANSWLVHP